MENTRKEMAARGGRGSRRPESLGMGERREKGDAMGKRQGEQPQKGVAAWARPDSLTWIMYHMR